MIGAVVVALGVVLLVAQRPSNTPVGVAPPPGPALAAAGNPSAQAVDGITCGAVESLAFHVHAHLAVYVDGRQALIPEGIGIVPPRRTVSSSYGPVVTGGTCFYWLHSHTADGIIHIESPVARTFTLGNYFDLWQQPLTGGQVAAAPGPVTAYLNGHLFRGDPRTIPLTAHALIQLDVGRADPAPQPFRFPARL
jgi:hypothetical protein